MLWNRQYGALMKTGTLVAMAVTMGLFGFGGKAKALEVGDTAPTPAAVDENNEPVDLAAAYADGVTLVYFYPKADTPGCTAQACSLRDSFADLADLDLRIFGASRDTPEAQRKFRDKYNLPFTLIADKDGKVAEAFGVPGIIGMPFSARQSFLVKDGKIAWKSESAKTSGHAGEVKAALEALD